MGVVDAHKFVGSVSKGVGLTLFNNYFFSGSSGDPGVFLKDLQFAAEYLISFNCGRMNMDWRSSGFRRQCPFHFQRLTVGIFGGFDNVHEHSELATVQRHRLRVSFRFKSIQI